MLRNVGSPELLELLDVGSPGDVDFYVQYARHTGGPVLVLLSGSGRVAIPVARQGIPVVGLDADDASIELARRKAQAANVARAIFTRADPTQFVSETKYAVAMIPAGALRHLVTLEAMRECLRSVRYSLQLGGKLVLDMPLLELETATEQAYPLVRRLGTHADQVAVIQRRQRFEAARQVQEELVSCEWMGNDGEVDRTQYTLRQHRYMTPGEVQLLLEVAGFQPTLYGGFDRRPLLPGAVRLVVEAERK